MTAAVAIFTGGHARLYATHGWRVFPIRPRTKRPLCPHGSTEATDNADQVADWWRRWPYANIGALVPNGLVVVDLDPRNGCDLDPGRLPATLTVRTGGGGWHLYFVTPASVHLAAHIGTFPGVDLIVAGRQVILPPSLHPSGMAYRWTVDAIPARLPGDLVDAFRRTPVCGGSFPWVPAGPGYLDAARTGVVEHLAAAATPGNRWRALTAAALRYCDLGLTVDDALADLLPAFPIAPDFTEGEARRTVESVWR